MNRTELYLANSLLLYPGLFETLNQYEIDGFFIGHKEYDEKYWNHIFVRIKNTEELEEVRDLQGYVTHYPWEDDWVVVIECPIKNGVKLFLEGKYSKLYNRIQINKLFRNRKLEDVIQVLRKSNVRRLSMEYELDVRIDKDAELDDLPKMQEECLF